MDLNKYIFENTNINFLLGSGASVPFLGTLSNIENWLTNLEKDILLHENKKNKLKAIFYKKYFEIAMTNNLFIINPSIRYEKIKFLNLNKNFFDEIKRYRRTINYRLKSTKNNYRTFFHLVNHLIYLRKNQVLNKQINIFTTNIDILNEFVLDEIGFDFNDGFVGRFNMKYDLSSFRRSYHKESLFFNKTSEISVFNIYKLHGSITWKYQNENIIFDRDLNLVTKLIEIKNKLNVPDIDITKNYEEIKKSINLDVIDNKYINEFIEKYEELQIINPTKEKFQETVFRKVHYELLRLFANELEKENSTLIVIGFSFADEHIREIVVRALNYNPLLNIFVFDYDGNGVKAIENEKSKIKNHNLHIIKPQGEKNYDFYTINEYLNDILKEIEND
jgi:hypothetical protein